jgi:hypothetical protein
MNMMKDKTYRQLLSASFKSGDTEEWLDVWFTRPIGLAVAMVCGRLGVTPNAITMAGIVLGAVAGWMFHYTDLPHNIAGVLLLMAANFCDSADGQLARLTNQKTVLGRLLDGFASDVWFFCIYVALVFRLWDEPMPLLGTPWQGWGFLLCAVAGFGCHATQSALADYYRNIHLWFLKGDSGSELDAYAKEQHIYDALSRRGWSFERLYHFFYKGYCRKQERLTPRFQLFFARYGQKPSPQVRDAFLQGSRPLMPLTNILTHNTRAITLFIAALTNIPWLYPLFEIVVLHPLYLYMRRSHERLSTRMTREIESK